MGGGGGEWRGIERGGGGREIVCACVCRLLCVCVDLLIFASVCAFTRVIRTFLTLAK